MENSNPDLAPVAILPDFTRFGILHSNGHCYLTNCLIFIPLMPNYCHDTKHCPMAPVFVPGQGVFLIPEVRNQDLIYFLWLDFLEGARLELGSHNHQWELFSIYEIWLIDSTRGWKSLSYDSSVRTWAGCDSVTRGEKSRLYIVAMIRFFGSCKYWIGQPQPPVWTS